MPTRCVMVEDHALIAQVLASALSTGGAEVTVVDPQQSDDVLADIMVVDPDLVLLDLDLGSAGDGADLVMPLREAGASVLMVTGVEDPVRRARCVRAGALGVVDKSASFDELLGAVEKVLAGGALLTEHEREEHLALLRDYEADRHLELAPFEKLTDREAEVLGALMHGISVEEIARDAVVSVSTVRTQVRAILDKLDVGSQLAAVGKARRARWTPPQER